MAARLVLLAAVLALLAPTSGQAQINRAELSATCSPTGVVLTADFEIVEALPAAWTGWIVERVTNGACEPVARIGDATPFPAGQQSWEIVDGSAEPGRSYRYQIFATDAGGNRLYLSTGNFWPAYYQTAWTACGSAPVAQGKLVDLGWTSGIEICDEDQCWSWTAFVSGLPPGLEPYVGTTTRVRLFGRLDDEFEGPYVAEVSGWELAGDCEAVDAAARSWGALKQRFR